MIIIIIIIIIKQKVQNLQYYDIYISQNTVFVPVLSTDIHCFFNVVSLCHAADSFLDWAWWNDNLTTMIADLTPLYFFVCGYFIDSVFIPLLLSSLEELRARITETVTSIVWT